MPVLKVSSVAEVEKQSRRQTLIIIVLSAVCLFGFSYAIYDYIQITNRVALPFENAEVDVALGELKASGLVSALNVAQSRLAVSEQKWRDLSHEEKIGMITRLAQYCAEKNNSELWSITVVGQESAAKLGELGLTGLIVN